MKKLPPYGALLSEKIKWGNFPLFGVVCIGAGAWGSAKKWNSAPNNIIALVCPSGDSSKKYKWQVSGLTIIVERLPGPGDDVIIMLVTELLKSGAESVLVIDKTAPEIYFAKYTAGDASC